jgi:nitrous oxidase accessory protein
MIRRLLSLCIVFGLSIAVSGKTITVDKNGQVKSIRTAIEKAAPGDTILVKSGVYREGNLRINKPLVLLGENFPTLDGEKKYEIITIVSDKVTVRGFRLTDTGHASMDDVAAVRVLNAKHITITGNRIFNAFFGIHFSNSSESIVQDNDLKATATGEEEIGNGIHMWKCHDVTIDHNRIEGHRDGIYFEFVTASFITRNISERNIRYGLHFMFSHQNTYRGNMFLHNGAGVAVMYTNGVKMYDNTFEQNWGGASYGLLLKEIKDSDVTGNHFIANTVGIHLEGVSRTRFERNDFLRNGYAVRLQASCDDNTFKENNFSSNTFDLATNGTMVLNSISGNYWDRYQGYDLDHDGTGDVPYRPVSMYSMIVERIPSAVLLWRSFLVLLMDRAEEVIPVVTPENLKDNAPSMKPYDRVQDSL